MEPKIVNCETITVLGVQARLTHMEEGVPEMWEVRFMAYHDRIVALSKGCLDYLGGDVSLPWLYGGTGHAFIISLDPGVDVSSPDSWNYQPQFDLGPNLGYTVDGFSVFKPDAGDAFPEGSAMPGTLYGTTSTGACLALALN